MKFLLNINLEKENTELKDMFSNMKDQFEEFKKDLNIIRNVVKTGEINMDDHMENYLKDQVKSAEKNKTKK